MGGCATRYRELDLTADSFSDTLQPSQVKFYGITLTREWLEKKLDLVIRVHVEEGYTNTHNRQQRQQRPERTKHDRIVNLISFPSRLSLCVLSSRLNGVYCARDRPFPNQRRKIWDTDRYCACPSPTCDHCYPYCMNEAGGLCIDCMVHDESWERTSHEVTLGGLGRDDPAKKEQTSTSTELAGVGSADAADVADIPYSHHADFEFSLRLSPSGVDAPLLGPGHFFLSIEAAPEVVPRAIRKKRRLEGDPEYHPTTYSLWIEERAPKGAPQLGNDARVAEAAIRIKERAERAALKKAFGRKVDAIQKKDQEQKEEEKKMRELGIEIGDENDPERNNKRISIAELEDDIKEM